MILSQAVEQYILHKRSLGMGFRSEAVPYLPVIRIGDGTLRYRLSQIEEFVSERERLSTLRRKRR